MEVDDSGRKWMKWMKVKECVQKQIKVDESG